MLYREILFFFSALGVFNCLVLAIYLLIRSFKSGYFMGLLGMILLCLGVRVGVSCLYFFEHTLSKNMLQLGLSAHVLSGVFLIEFLRYKGESLKKSSRIHLSSAILILVLGGFMYPFTTYTASWDIYIRFSFHLILSIYLIGGGIILMKSRLSRQKHTEVFQKKLIFGFICASCFAFAISLFTSYVLGPVLFSLIFYAALSLYYFYKHPSPVQGEKYSGKKIETNLAEDLIEKLKEKVEGDQLYLRPNLSLEEVAQSLRISRHQLSQLLNDNLGKSFSSFINAYRIAYAKKLLLSETNLSIEAIAYEVGFNSKSSFYSIFKKQCGQTPANFRNKNVWEKTPK